MNILFLSTHLNSGGITSYLLTLTKGFLKKGHVVNLVTSGGNMEEEFKRLGARVFIFNIRTKSELDPRIYFALKPLKKIIHENRIHIIHAQTRITQLMASLLSQYTKTPHVSTCHGFFKKRLSRILFPCWGKVVIAVSPAVKEHLRADFGILEERIALVGNGVDIDGFPLITDHERKLNRQKYHLDEGLVAGVIARLSHVKGQDILIKAMPRIGQSIPSFKLYFFGEGREEQSLKDLVKALHLEDRIQFFPTVNNTRESLSILDVFVMPSRQEGLGLSIMEAQACGLRVVASRVGGIPYLIEDGKTGFLVEPENEKALADRLIDVLSSPQKYQEVGLAARDFIKKHHSAETMVEKTLRVYETLL